MSVDAVSRGRPRDPAVELRVLEAAADLYGELGWSGFSIGASSITPRTEAVH